MSGKSLNEFDRYKKEHYDYRYEVRENGYIIDHERDRFIIPSLVKKGEDWSYPAVRLVSKDGFTYSLVLHRLVLMWFNPTTDKTLLCNHKNGDKSDFSLENLEWVTPSENAKHAYENNLIKNAAESRDLVNFNNKRLKGPINSLQKAKELIQDIIDRKPTVELEDKYKVGFRYISAVRRKKKFKYLWDTYFPGYDVPVFEVFGVTKKRDFKSLFKHDLDKRIKIIEALRFRTNKDVADEFLIDPSVLSRVRARITWQDAIEIHNDIFKIPISTVSFNISPINDIYVNMDNSILNDFLINYNKTLYKSRDKFSNKELHELNLNILIYMLVNKLDINDFEDLKYVINLMTS